MRIVLEIHLAGDDPYLRDDPGNVDLLTALAECLLEAGRPEEALGVLDSALAHAPEDAQLRFGRAIALHRLGRIGDAVVELEVASGRSRCRPRGDQYPRPLTATTSRARSSR